jgi:ferredoxin
MFTLLSENHFIRRYTVSHVISDDCTNCGACVDSCPVNAIAPASDKHKIDADTCIDCGACVDTCPVSAISPA